MRIKFSILILSLCISCTSEQKRSPEEAPAIPVITTTPVIKDVTVYLEAIGTLHPSVSMEVRPQVSGTIDSVLITEGQSVEQGTPLFSIDSTPYKIKVREAKAQLAIDQAGFQAAEKKMNRFRELAQKDLISQSEWDELETQVAKAQATIDLDKARLNTTRLDLERCTLKSSVEGRVGKVDAHPGLLVTAGQTTPLVTIVKLDPLIVEFSVTEKEYANIHSWDLPIEMQPLCNGELCRNGTITFLDNHFDAKTGLLLIRGKVENQGHSLRPGQSVRVRIPVSVTSQAKLIPQKSIKYNQQCPYVYVIQEDNTVSVRPLILGEEQGHDQIVIQGIEPNERIVTDGHLRLSPGVKVEIK